MSHTTLRRLGSLLGIVLLFVSLWFIYGELEGFNYEDFANGWRGIPVPMLLLSIGFIVLDYLSMTGYDLLSLRYIGKRLPLPDVAFASFIGQSFTINIDVLTGASIRYRMYSRFGLSFSEMTKLNMFSLASFLTGFVTLGGLLFVLEPPIASEDFQLPFILSLRTLGIVCLCIAVAYVTWSALSVRRLTIGGHAFAAPDIHLTVWQMLLSCLDWMLSAAALYLLLSSHGVLPYHRFLEVFFLAQFIGQISQAPAGLGVFEYSMLLMLKDVIPTSKLLGVLLVYRVLYYFLPFIVAAALFFLSELFAKRTFTRQVS